MDNSGFKKMNKKRNIKDFFGQFSTYFFSSFTIIALIAIFVFVFSKGWKNLKWSFIFGDYQTTVYTISTDSEIEKTNNTFSYEAKEGEYFASNWGLAFKNSKNNEGNQITILSYVANNSNTNNLIDTASKKPIQLKANQEISSLILWTTADKDTAEVVMPNINDAKEVCDAFNKCSYLKTMSLKSGGLGMRGSLITTLYMILITMLVALPFSLGASIYLSLYSKNNALARILKSLIDMISGIPSVIFGLVGGIVFVPLFSGRVSILAGSFTMACMILPIIIKSTEESIDAIPKSYRDSSLALGASMSQTVFKVILPNALPGILSSAILGVGRVIGESAALVYTAGTAIQDYILPTRGSASLAVHIWVLMSGENQNFDASCTIAIVILFTILILNLLVKLLTRKIVRFKGGK